MIPRMARRRPTRAGAGHSANARSQQQSVRDSERCTSRSLRLYFTSRGYDVSDQGARFLTARRRHLRRAAVPARRRRRSRRRLADGPSLEAVRPSSRPMPSGLRRVLHVRGAGVLVDAADSGRRESAAAGAGARVRRSRAWRLLGRADRHRAGSRRGDHRLHEHPRQPRGLVVHWSRHRRGPMAFVDVSVLHHRAGLRAARSHGWPSIRRRPSERPKAGWASSTTGQSHPPPPDRSGCDQVAIRLSPGCDLDAIGWGSEADQVATGGRPGRNGGRPEWHNRATGRPITNSPTHQFLTWEDRDRSERRPVRLDFHRNAT